MRLPDISSIYSAPVKATDLALSLAKENRSNRFYLFSDSHLTLRAFYNIKTDNPSIFAVRVSLSLCGIKKFALCRLSQFLRKILQC